MVSSYIILRDFTVVFSGFLGNAIHHIGFLQQGIADVALISEHILENTRRPLLFAGGRWDTVRFQRLFDFADAGSGIIAAKYSLDHFRFLRHNLGLAILTFFVTQQAFILKRHIAVLEALALAPCHIAADGLALGLCKAAEKAQRHFAGHLHGVDALFFKDDRDALGFELADVGDGIQRVPRKSGDRFGQHHVNLALFTERHELEKLVTLFGAGAGDALVSKYPGQLPILVLGYFVGVISNLRSVAGLLFFLLGADPAVGRHTQLFLSGAGFAHQHIGRNQIHPLL